MNRLKLKLGALLGSFAAAVGCLFFISVARVPPPPSPLVTLPPVPPPVEPSVILPPADTTPLTFQPTPLVLPYPAPQPPPPIHTPDASPPPLTPQKNPDARSSEVIMFPSEAADRVAAARLRSEATLRALFAQAGVKYPAQQIFLRGFKREAELELWAADRSGPWKLVATYAAAALSGRPGPKRREGDGQVPEGFYEIDRFNPQSNFHLSLGLNYPNAADRLLGDRDRPGYDIFIHGNAISIGCLAMGDDRIEEIYLAATDARARPIRVHLFPARMTASDWPAWRDEQTHIRPNLAAFWNELRPGWDLFETEREIPRVTVLPDGRYHCVSGRK